MRRGGVKGRGGEGRGSGGRGGGAGGRRGGGGGRPNVDFFDAFFVGEVKGKGNAVDKLGRGRGR